MEMSPMRARLCVFFFFVVLSFSLSEFDDKVREELCCTWRVTVETPSTNFVLNRTLAFENMPSFKETTMN